MEEIRDSAADKVPKVDSCCCGLVSLETGTYIIGVLTFLVQLVAHGYFLTYYPQTELAYKIYIGLIITGLVASILLIIGVYYHERKFVSFFLIIYGLLLITTILLITICILQDCGLQDDYVIDILDGVVYCVLITYCMIVVYSYFKTI